MKVTRRTEQPLMIRLARAHRTRRILLIPCRERSCLFYSKSYDRNCVLDESILWEMLAFYHDNLLANNVSELTVFTVLRQIV